jgi:hypothetical protein
MLKVASTLIVDRIEPSVRFWTEQLGFTKVTRCRATMGWHL